MRNNSIHLDSNASLTHFFTYKKKAYPFNIVVFNLFSQYFDKRQNLSTVEIKILEDNEEDNLNLAENAIEDFVNFCQNQPINITQDNFITIHKLATKFIVPSLIHATEAFFYANRQQLIDEYLSSLKDQQDMNPNEAEEIIANDFSKYVNDERLLELPLPVLQRIMAKYQLKSSIEPPEVSDFLFKCLDKYGRSGSILFKGFDFGYSNCQIIRNLIKNYTDKFDFECITNVHVRTIYELEKEHKEIEEKLEQRMSELYTEYSHKIDEAKNALNSQIEAIEKYRNKMKDEMNSLLRQNKESQEKFEKEANQLNNKINHLNEKILMNEESHRIMSIENAKLKEEVNKLADILTKNNEEAEKNTALNCPYVNSNEPKGILSKLGNEVVLKAGANEVPSHPLSNIRNFDNQYFANSFNYVEETRENSYILFDFGEKKKVDLDSYLIRTGDSSNTDAYPKDWSIEGSNDKLIWVILDRQTNESSLRGANNIHYFKCPLRHEGDPKYRFRYIRYIQSATWNRSHPYVIKMTFFELFGDVYESDN